MNIATACVLCGSGDLAKLDVPLAEFICRYVFDGQRPACHIAFCRACSMCFSDVRYSDEEMTRLYGDYRGEEYCAVRESCEPGYSRLNALIGRNPIELESRKRNLERIVLRHGLGNSRRVLDYGGDRGQFIPPAFSGSDRYVFEVSGSRPIEGVKSIEHFAGERDFDFIMCCHVLEHVADPSRLVEELKSLLSPGGTLYVEVPADISMAAFASLLRGKWLVSPGSRALSMVVEEHINFFGTVSLVNLMNLAGLRVDYCGKRLLDLGWTRYVVYSCLASRAASDPGRERRILSPRHCLPDACGKLALVLYRLLRDAVSRRGD